jgi:hypothetical protein
MEAAAHQEQTEQTEVAEQMVLAELTEATAQVVRRGLAEQVEQTEVAEQMVLAVLTEVAEQAVHQGLVAQTEVAALAVRRGHQELAVQMVVQGLMEVRVPMVVQERRAQVARRGLSVQVERRVQMVQVVNHHYFMVQVAIQLYYH